MVILMYNFSSRKRFFDGKMVEKKSNLFILPLALLLS